MMKSTLNKLCLIRFKHLLILCFLIFFCGIALAQSDSLSQKDPVYLLNLEGVINPFTAKYVKRGIGQAERDGAQLIILQMDTPGGLDTSMREINSAILNARLPVAVLVGPKGARAASAGVFITYAADIAAMAPGTNIGAAHFVNLAGGDDQKDDSWVDKILELYEEAEKRKLQETEKPDISESVETEIPINDDNSDNDKALVEPADDPESLKTSRFKSQQEVMAEKITNDAVAYVQAIADIHGRNRDWAEQAVRESVSITAEEAFEINVIEYLADTVDDLVLKLDGLTIQKGKSEYYLKTADAPIHYIPMTGIEKLFLLITNPQIAYFLLMIGVYGLIYEVTHPGAIVPGVLGGTSLVLAILAFNLLPITAVGVVLLLLGVAFMVAELKVPGFGIMAVMGVICFILGSFLLIDRNYDELVIKPSTYLPMTFLTGLLFLVLLPKAWKALRKKVVATGTEGIIEMAGFVVKDLEPYGKVYVHGEYWNAKSSDGSTIIKDEKIVVVSKDFDEMELVVKKKI